MEENIINSEEALKDADMVQIEGQEATPPALVPESQTPAPLEINSLEEAMRFYNQTKQKAAEADVPAGKPEAGKPSDIVTPAQGTGEAGAPDASLTPPQEDQGVAGSALPGSTDAGTVPGGTGESTGYVELYDADAGVAEVRQQLMNITADAVRKDFAAKGVKMLQVSDLMQKDEKSGTIEFINPDTKRPFNSSNPRGDAQAFVNAYNADINADFKQACQNLLPQVEQSYKPVIEFHQFLPKWQQMDEMRQEMFEELVAGHELKDKQGNIVAYSCDLNAVHNQMEKQIQWLLSKQQQMQSAQSIIENPVTQPAVAAKTATQQVTAEDDTPDLSTVEGSLRYYNKKKAEKAEKGNQ